MMSAFRFRRLTVGLGAALGLLGALACGGHKGGGSSSSHATIQGTVTYVRVPLATDSNGVPTGLQTDSTKFTTLPARNVTLRLYQRQVITPSSGSPVVQWTFSQNGATDSNGHYIFNVTPGGDYTIELTGGTDGSAVHLIADPDGLASTLPQSQRLRYGLRKAPDGTAATVANVAPYSTVNADVTVNFAVDLSTTWLLTRSDYDVNTKLADFVTSSTFEPTASGSRILGILDTVYNFQTNYNAPSLGGPLDLHYRPGISDAGGSYIEYDRDRWVQPSGLDLAFDGTTASRHYFGSLQGGSSNDDAWDEAVIYVMLARGTLFYSQGFFSFAEDPNKRILPLGQPMDGLTPDMALLEGLPRAIAANLLKSPYLADTNAGGLVSLTDVRDLTGVSAAKGIRSSKTIGALSWELVLKANSITSPGTPTQWATINPLAAQRFFLLKAVQDGSDTSNLYVQLNRLAEGKQVSEPVDLATIFTNATLTPMLAPFNVTWPRPTTGADANTTLVNAWGQDPSAVEPSITLDMSQAQQVNGSYPNVSADELAFAYFSLSKDSLYNVSVTTSPNPLPSGATVQVDFLSLQPNPQGLTLTGSTSAPVSMVFTGNNTTPVGQPVRIRLISPNTLQAQPITLTFTLAKAPTP